MDALNLNSFVSVPVSVRLYGELSRRYPDRVSSVAEEVIWDFLERTADGGTGAKVRGGVQWGPVRLPEGTEIRTKHYGEYKIATIQKGQIVWGGRSYSSMSRLAAAMRGNTSNNAWRVLEIRRPNDPHWQPADLLRR